MTMALSTTIGQAKAWLMTRLDDGDNCPVCHQRVQMYKRKINSGMARSLIHMYRIDPQGWIHVHAIGALSREEGKLAYWGLLEEQKAIGIHGGRAGYWRLTQRGRDFVERKISVPTYARVYNGKVYGFTGSMITIRDSLGTRFNYDDLMAGR